MPDTPVTKNNVLAVLERFYGTDEPALTPEKVTETLTRSPVPQKHYERVRDILNKCLNKEEVHRVQVKGVWLYSYGRKRRPEKKNEVGP